MANKINKVIDRNGNTLIDLTTDTVSPSKVLAGTTFHGPDGKEYTGLLNTNELDSLKYTFIDYNGDIIYTLSDDEIDALSELPAGPNHTDENLTFQEWNWTLDELKAWDRTRIDRPIVGANFVTTDGKTYMYLDTPISNCSITVYTTYLSNAVVNWGDGTEETLTTANLTHTYANPGVYTITLNITTSQPAIGCYIGINNSTSLPSGTAGQCFVKSVKLGNDVSIREYGFRSCYSLETISIPSHTYISSDSFVNCVKLNSLVISRKTTTYKVITQANSILLKFLSLPNTISTYDREYSFNTTAQNIVIPFEINTTNSYIFNSCQAKEFRFSESYSGSISQYSFSGCSNVRKIVLPSGVTGVGSYAFSGCNNLQEIVIPNIKTISQYAFSNTPSLKTITLPDSVTSISSNAFANWYGTLDLSQQTKVITANGNPNFTLRGLRILVPMSLLSQYKTASYWSNFAAYMVGV